MKIFFRLLITGLLKFQARRFLRKHRTQVIGVTGSIGKTSAKQAIYTVLKDHFSPNVKSGHGVYASPEGFNTEIGLSLAILQEEKSGFSSPFKWLGILKRVFFGKKPPYQKMVLEMGADAPGDIKKLVHIAQPKIGVVTSVAPVHLDQGQFKDIYEIAREKNQLIAKLPKEGLAIINDDDPLVREMKTSAHRITYGTQATAEVRASDIIPTTKQLKFTVHYKGESCEFDVPVLGAFQIYVLLPAIAVGLKLGLTLEQCAKALYHFRLPPGRMNPIDGLNKSHIIDSSYNASPMTMTAALNLLAGIKADRKIAVLGTMNELGPSSKEAHMAVGKQAASFADLLVAVGSEATTLKKGAMEGGMAENKVYTFFDSEEAGHFLQKELKSKDLVLVKGSQNRVRMERLVKIIMAYPEKASELLCRQDTAWEKI
ncbi:MAG: UDP-N-acetylmuramoyl-tripeptide--D-alanyl-D-alanine ligase [Candidatus Peregrinibacteria bacterium]